MAPPPAAVQENSMSWPVRFSGIVANSAEPRRFMDRPAAVAFDTDGVITRTAAVHAAAWAAMFDGYLASLPVDVLPPDRRGPFTQDDYRRYVDGRKRYDGVALFLASRGLHPPPGDIDDPPDRPTVHGLGNRKNQQFLRILAEDGVQPYESTLTFVRRLRAVGVKVAAVSASENCALILAAAGAGDLFDTRVDGITARELDLAGKPDPAMFVEAAHRLGEPVERTAVVEDAIAGTEAGRRGGFGLVVGVDRTGHPEDLLASGADVTVSDLAEVTVDDAGRWTFA
jgi:alpha,alpha-trehalase